MASICLGLYELNIITNIRTYFIATSLKETANFINILRNI